MAGQSTYRADDHDDPGPQIYRQGGKELYMTELGTVVNDIMKKAFPTIVDPSFTANMEALLDGIADGKVRWKTVIENFYPDLHEAVLQAETDLEKVQIADEETEEICENCGRHMVIKYGPHGKFLGLSRIPGMSQYQALLREDRRGLSQMRQGYYRPHVQKGPPLLRLYGKSRVRFHGVAEAVRQKMSPLRRPDAGKGKPSCMCR